MRADAAAEDAHAEDESEDSHAGQGHRRLLELPHDDHDDHDDHAHGDDHAEADAEPATRVLTVQSLEAMETSTGALQPVVLLVPPAACCAAVDTTPSRVHCLQFPAHELPPEALALPSCI